MRTLQSDIRVKHTHTNTHRNPFHSYRTPLQTYKKTMVTSHSQHKWIPSPKLVSEHKIFSQVNCTPMKHFQLDSLWKSSLIITYVFMYRLCPIAIAFSRRARRQCRAAPDGHDPAQSSKGGCALHQDTQGFELQVRVTL